MLEILCSLKSARWNFMTYQKLYTSLIPSSLFLKPFGSKLIIINWSSENWFSKRNASFCGCVLRCLIKHIGANKTFPLNPSVSNKNLLKAYFVPSATVGSVRAQGVWEGEALERVRHVACWQGARAHCGVGREELMPKCFGNCIKWGNHKFDCSSTLSLPF